MKRFLPLNKEIYLTSAGTEFKFIIEKVLGGGGSCIAYRVKYFENGDIPHAGVLKEYCPAFLDEENFERNDTEINVPASKKEAFNEGLSQFRKTYKAINEYLTYNPSAANYHTVQIGLYEGNNTAYTLTSCDYGVGYDKVDGENLLSVCKTMLSVTKAVELYHNAGFLHLDIKPENILILNGVTDLIKLFDYDSLTSLEMLRSRKVQSVPLPGAYRVPELESFDLRNIGVETDIFEIGAMLFLKVFGKAPEDEDMGRDAKYPIEKNPMFTGVSPQAKSEFSELLKNTVQISKRNRYRTTKDLKNKLEKIISLLSEEKPYLVDLPKWQPSKYCIGRRDEIREIKRRLDEDGYVFVKGIGGLGKSEVAKLFARQYKEEYHTVQFCKFTDSLRSLVATMPVNGIDERNYKNADELIKEKNKILHLSDSKTLIIVDNFNVTYDDFLRDFLPADNDSFKVIFTTRCTMAAEYYEEKTFALPELSMQECKELFRAHLSSSEIYNEETAEKLIEFVDYNTLIIVLMAAAVRKSGLTLAQMLSVLEEQKMDSIEEKFFHEYDFSSDEVSAYNRIYAHLGAIFSISGLTDVQKEILKNATLISLNGIGSDEFVRACSSDNFDKEAVDGVADLGWLSSDYSGLITMHPIVSDMLSANEELYKWDSYYNFADYLEDYCTVEKCHFSVLLNKLACAKQLDRRYIFEDYTRQCIVKLRLGSVYKELYQPGDARKCLKKALALAENHGDDEGFVCACFFLGGVEKAFGTHKSAIEYYNKCIEKGEPIKGELSEFVMGAMKCIAEIYDENNNKEKAYNSFLQALNYAKKQKLYEYISYLAARLADLCKEFDWPDKCIMFRKIEKKYTSFSSEPEGDEAYAEFNRKAAQEDTEGALVEYEKLLAVKREELGEDSPAYKEIKGDLWHLYAVNGHREQALYLMNESLNFIAETSGKNSMEMARELSLAANMMIEFSDYKTAKIFSEEAIRICEENDAMNEFTCVEAVFSLAMIYLLQGKTDAAEEVLDKVDLSQYSGNEALKEIVEVVSAVLCQPSRFDELEPLCMELIEKKNIPEKDKFFAYINLAIMNEQRGIFEKAEEYADCAEKSIASSKRKTVKRDWMIGYFRLLARIRYRKGRPEEGVAILNEYLESFDEEEKNSLMILQCIYSDRGLLYFFCGETEKAIADYKKCEEMLTENDFPLEAYSVLYNNIALNYTKTGCFDEAEKYLEKIVSINPTVITDPDTYFEAIVCGNFGWVYYNLDRKEEAFDLLKKSVKVFEELGTENSKDYLSAKNNLAIICAEKEMYFEAFRHNCDIRKNYRPEYDPTGEIAKRSNWGILFALFNMDKADEAYEFALDDMARLKRWFGEASPVRIEIILQMVGIFRNFLCAECYDFMFYAEKLIETSGDFESLNYAVLLNFIGVYLGDEEEKHVDAKFYFEKSKRLFEKLGMTDSEYYPVVAQNIKNMSELIMDSIIADMAKDIMDEQGE